MISFYSIDRSNSLTVITQDSIRYVIPGDVNELPKSNYATFDVSNITSLGDGIWICWQENGTWDLTIHDGILVQSDLDTSKYSLHTSLPRDERGVPTELKYRQNNCSVFDYYSMQLSPNQGSIVEIK